MKNGRSGGPFVYCTETRVSRLNRRKKHPITTVLAEILEKSATFDGFGRMNGWTEVCGPRFLSRNPPLRGPLSSGTKYVGTLNDNNSEIYTFLQLKEGQWSVSHQKHDIFAKISLF